jgi:SecD/SecF fusion protein
MVGAVRRRVDPGGVQELTIRQVGKDRIELIIPKASAEAIEKIKRQMTTVGSLEFDLLANNRDHRDIIRRGQSAERDVRSADGRVIAGWRPIAPLTVMKDGKKLEVPDTNFPTGGEISVRQIKGKPEGYQEVLVIIEPDANRRVTGGLLQRSNPEVDSSGRPAVGFTFNTKGAFLFSQLTGANKPSKDGFQRRLAVVLDGRVESAPSIEDTIGAHGIIRGNFSGEQVRELVNVLNAGALEVPLRKDPISEFSISPTLGVDVQQKGITSLIFAVLAVFAFMAYYRYLGLVADLCLVLNLILLVGCMAMIDATFTLPGLAGVVLTMGMAVDANVLIYERMREELERGSSQRMAIHNGFSKAFSSIFDSNITTLLTAVILYMIGSDQVKGFAVTLFIGLSISMYTALTVNRLILEIVDRKRWVKQFKMFNMFGVTNFDFVGKQKICALGSIVMITIGLVAFFARGQASYDIDFTGGTMVSMEFAQPMSAEEVRDKLTSAFQSDIALEQLTSSNPAQAGKRYRVRTTNQDDAAVRQTINNTFPDQLKRVTLQYGKVVPATAAPAFEKPEGQPAPETLGVAHETELSFSSPVTTDTIARYLMDELAKIEVAGKPKYGTPEETTTLFKLEGEGNSNAEIPAEGQVHTYQKIKLIAEPALAEQDLKSALGSMQHTLANTPLFDEVNNFEAAVASETKESAVLAMLASLVMIVAYVWFRFQNVYFGLAAVLALLHDVLFTLGMVALAGWASNTPLASIFLLSDFKVNLTMIAAFLTIVGYSLNDTIVIFDRLREIRGKNPAMNREMINLAVNQTLSRTILTAGTVFVTVIILYAMGGEGVHGFAYAMLIGTVVGCYSTIYVASPAVLWLMERGKKSPQNGGAASRAPVKTPA